MLSQATLPPASAVRAKAAEREFLAATALRPKPRNKYVLAVGAAAAAVALWVVTRPAPKSPQVTSQAASPAAEPAADANSRSPAPTAKSETPTSPTAAASPPDQQARVDGTSDGKAKAEKADQVAAQKNNAPAQEAADSAQRATAPTDAAKPAAEGAAKGEKVFVHITAKPADVQLFYRGKSIGKPPLTVELKPGEVRTFEAILPGHTTRKVRIDGTKPEIMIGLRPLDSATP